MLNTIARLLHLLRISWAVWRVRKAKNEDMRNAARQTLAGYLAGGRGLPMKIGQVLAGMDDHHTAFQPLTQSVEPWQLQDMKPVLEQAWGKPVDDVLESIEESFAAASLGQVHQAKLKSGQLLAIKIQYPDIKHAIATEMSLAGLMPRGGPVKRWDFDLDAYKVTLNENMLQELDYKHEKEQQIAFKNAIDVQGLSVPSIVDDLCRGNVLAQTWVEGHRLSVAKGWNQL
ncbi:MAG: AarF/UbiB family protein, partial [Ghiorsea sp.]